ncbi:MAG TPA: methyltransferase [Micromonosporaceae bacterium]|nr:methyltransferase [Micromonosporaceae bacterium]
MSTGAGSLARRRLLGILSGAWLGQACYAVVKLGVPDLLAQGPRTVDDLAAATGAHPRVLHRLLRALAGAGVLRQADPGTFALSSTGELLRSDAPGSTHLVALMHGEEVFRSFAEIMHTVRTGTPAFEKVYGRSFYAYLDENPDAASTFVESMGDQPVPAGLSTCDLSGVGTLVDVGGGNGTLLAEALTAHPRMRGVLLERPDAVAAARARLGEAGLADRVRFVAGSFFDTVPAGGDAYVLARVLHNWNDEHALEILRRVHAAAPPGARLLVLEELLPDADPPPAGLGDLLMLVTLEGFDRTGAEYRELLVKAGFDVLAVRHVTGRQTGGVVEATRI